MRRDADVDRSGGGGRMGGEAVSAIERAETLLAQITPGPWSIWPDGRIVQRAPLGGDYVTVRVVVDTRDPHEGCGVRIDECDAEFIATAPGLVRDLLGVIEKQEAWKAEAMAVMEGIQDLGAALDIALGASCTGREALAAVNLLRAEAHESGREAARLANQIARVAALADKWEEWGSDECVASATELRAVLAGGGE